MNTTHQQSDGKGSLFDAPVSLLMNSMLYVIDDAELA